MLTKDQDYRDLGPQHLPELDRQRRTQRLARQLQHLGYEVTLHEAA
jgi:hypothetical protein